MAKMSRMHRRVLQAELAALALAALPAVPALAQSSDGAALQTVTVTAQRRTENIRDVPLAVSALRGEKLDVLTSGGQGIRLLAGKLPSLNVESSNGRTFPRFYIRGYGNTDFNTFASQPVSLIHDEVVQENPILKGFPIFDVANVEVLRGPQGTLFGRNTPAGVVKFESEKPNTSKVEGNCNASVATHNTIKVEGAVNVPLSQDWAMRVSTLRQHRDDYVENYSDLAMTQRRGDLDGVPRPVPASFDKKHFNPVIAENVTQIGNPSVDTSKAKFSWDLSGTYKLTPSANLYGRVATGFRAPSIAAASASVPITVADAETITSYEACIKADLFERRGRVAFSVYDYTVKDQQLKRRIHRQAADGRWPAPGLHLGRRQVRSGPVRPQHPRRAPHYRCHRLQQLTGFTNEPRTWGVQFKGNF
ncbi:TonB-dependent receptor domain-containing protein [Massilia sp. Se16.2.3]|uniref:TonB-dependent receptor domain-containing protein n=1 Tax=unclassified Massilia TaxID=2609279 RepID=UPI0035A614BA